RGLLRRWIPAPVKSRRDLPPAAAASRPRRARSTRRRRNSPRESPRNARLLLITLPVSECHGQTVRVNEERENHALCDYAHRHHLPIASLRLPSDENRRRRAAHVRLFAELPIHT